MWFFGVLFLIVSVWGEIPRLETERLILRGVELSDAAETMEIIGDFEVVKLTAMNFCQTEEAALSYARFRLKEYEIGLALPWVVIEKGSGQMVGIASLFDLSRDQRRGEISYVLARSAWGKGYATEIAKELIRFGFNDLNLVRIQGSTHPENEASSKVLEKVGMQYEGLLRSYKMTQGKPSDRKMYAIINGRNYV